MININCLDSLDEAPGLVLGIFVVLILESLVRLWPVEAGSIMERKFLFQFFAGI